MWQSTLFTCVISLKWMMETGVLGNIVQADVRT